MPKVSPHDQRSTRFYATIKRQVIVDFAGEEPNIVEELGDPSILNGFQPVDFPEGEEAPTYKFGDLVEAAVCKQSGWVVPVEDLNENGVSQSYLKSQIPAELLEMTKEELIALVMSKQAASTPEATVQTAEASEAKEGDTEQPSSEVEGSSKSASKSADGETKRTRRRKADADKTEGDTPEAPAQESPTEAPESDADPLEGAERIPAVDKTSPEELDVEL